YFARIPSLHPYLDKLAQVLLATLLGGYRFDHFRALRQSFPCHRSRESSCEHISSCPTYSNRDHGDLSLGCVVCGPKAVLVNQDSGYGFFFTSRGAKHCCSFGGDVVVSLLSQSVLRHDHDYLDCANDALFGL